MPLHFAMPAGAIPADLPQRLRLQIVTPTAEPPEGDRWLHEIKHDGHRLIAISTGDRVRLLSRNDRTRLFAEPFRALAAAGLPALVLDGEIAVPDVQGMTHLDALNAAIAERRPERFAYFAFDLVYFNGHDLRSCALEKRKALLREVIATAGGDRIVYVDHVIGQGGALLSAARQAGAEGIVSKNHGSAYRGGETRDWLKAKASETGTFVITGFSEVHRGRLDTVYVAELRDDALVPAGAVRFGLSKDLWRRLDRLRAGPARLQGRGLGIVPVRAELVVEIKYFGRMGGDYLRDGVLLAVHEVTSCG
jgi:bifunctional non-homologous end joining protein LigD